MAHEYLSLREIGRRLGIPPSSVVYYKDRFTRYIPMHGPAGRRARYPAEALGVFREIREMFNRNWSSEQIEERLEEALNAAEPFGERDAEAAMPGSDASYGSAAGSARQAARHDMMDRVAGLLESHALFRAEIETLRSEVQSLRTGKQRTEEQYRDRVIRLEQEVQELRRERVEILRQVRGAAESVGSVPPRSLLTLPLVIGKDGEFLGVAGKRGHFSLGDFVGLIERRRTPAGGAASATPTGGAGGIGMCWTEREGVWTLGVSLAEPDGAREHELDVTETMTQKGNRVARLVRMVVDGQPVPDRYLLLLFRNIREEFET